MLIDDLIKERGIKYSFLASKIGISEQLFKSKRSGETKWKADELVKLCEAMKLDDETTLAVMRETAGGQ